MHHNFVNVNDAFQTLVTLFYQGKMKAVLSPSRVGEVSMVTEPVTISYEKPTQRVLFSLKRDANPFFHLYEALWMLAGRNDVAPLAYYSSKIAGMASDDGETFNGAYGYRWRHAQVDDYVEDSVDSDLNGVDQLKIILDHFQRNPKSRRAVLQMWTVEDDLMKIDTSKDVCCNTNVYFSIEDGVCKTCGGKGTIIDTEGRVYECYGCKGMPSEVPAYLNMTVCNRSNDLILGALGANVVHFSFLQEYMTLSLGLQVGTYHQFTNNLHYYTNDWNLQELLKEYSPRTMHSPPIHDYNRLATVPLLRNREVFDKELPKFVEQYSKPSECVTEYQEPFLMETAQPMLKAFQFYKTKDWDKCILYLTQIHSEDWAIAATNWIMKRYDLWKNRTANAVRPMA